MDIDSLLAVPGKPSESDQLFAPESDNYNNARLYWRGAAWDLYSSGYKEGADLLVEGLEQGRGILDKLVYPIVFLYRQHIELEVKMLLRAARHVQNVSGEFKLHHNIDHLWQGLRPLLSDISKKTAEDELDQVGRLIREFASIDPQSMAFRYPEDKSGAPTLQGIDHINVRNIRDVIAKISFTLSGFACYISEIRSFQLEQEAEYRNNFY